MDRWISWISPARACLFLALLLYIALWILCPQEFSSSDQYAYSSSAFAISQNLDFGSSCVFTHRLAITIPVAFLYSTFGIGIITTNLWALCAALIVFIAVWLSLPDDKSKIVATFLCLTSVPLFKSSVDLLPDIIASAFMVSSSLVLFNRWRLIQGRRSWLLAPLVAVSLLFLAFLAKESAYWVLPLWAWALFSDIKDKERGNVLLHRFYLPVFGAGVFLGVMYLVFCHVIWGDSLARFKSIQAITGQHLWSWDKVPLGALVKRLTISPVHFLLSQYGAPILLLSLLGFVIAPRSIRPWGYFAILCLLFFWFGSTSFTRYEPMPLVDRMTLPMLPAFYILASFAASRLSITSDRSGWINSFIPILLVLGFTGLPFAQYVNSWRGNELPEATSMSIVRKEVYTHPHRQYLLVCSDKFSPLTHSFYFGYRYPENLHVVSPDNLTDELLRSEERLVFINRHRSNFLKSAYGSRHYDDEIDLLDLATVYKSGEVSLLRSERQDELRSLVLPNKRIERGE